MSLRQETNEFVDDEAELEDDGLGCLTKQEEEKNVKSALKTFFSDKKHWCGGNLSTNLIFSDKHIQILLETSVEVGVSIAHFSMDRESPEHVDTTEEMWSIRLINTILGEASIRGIPKSYLGGLVILYLELCEGVSCLRNLTLFKTIKRKYLYNQESEEVIEARIIDENFTYKYHSEVEEELDD